VVQASSARLETWGACSKALGQLPNGCCFISEEAEGAWNVPIVAALAAEGHADAV
jgi:hypothetical protein